jgi:hypothetical protein
LYRKLENKNDLSLGFQGCDGWKKILTRINEIQTEAFWFEELKTGGFFCKLEVENLYSVEGEKKTQGYLTG